MRLKFAVLPCFAILSACGPRTVHLANDRCWNVKPGDRVSGNLTVVGIVDDTLVEGGAYIQNTACPKRTLGVAIPKGPMLDGYKMRMRVSPPRFVDHQFMLTGHVFENRGSDRLLVMAESLKPTY